MRTYWLLIIHETSVTITIKFRHAMQKYKDVVIITYLCIIKITLLPAYCQVYHSNHLDVACIRDIITIFTYTCQIREKKPPFWNFIPIANMASTVTSFTRATIQWLRKCQHARKVTADLKHFWQFCRVILST